jgi:hypothetical protein
MSIIFVHLQGSHMDTMNCQPVTEQRTIDHRQCPAAIAVDDVTGMEAEWPAHWPTRIVIPEFVESDWDDNDEREWGEFDD